MVASAPSEGAETSTRLAPAVRCAEAFALALKMPVHSSAMSTPSSFHGSVEGSRTAVTLILPLPRLIESPSTVTVPGNRPCTESKRSRWALVSTGPRSLIPTTSMSLRPDSAMARSTLRPIRPNPLIATRTAMLVSPLIADAGPADLRPRSFLRRIARFGRARTDYMRGYLVLFAGKLNRNGPSALVPTFRGSHPVTAPIFCEPRKANGHPQTYDSRAAFRIEVPGTNSPLVPLGLQFDGPSRFRAALTAASGVLPKCLKGSLAGALAPKPCMLTDS